MADLRLIHPEAGQNVAVESTEHTRFVLDFPSADAVTSRDGGDLVFTFPDGANFRVTNFYTTYHLENMPEFVLDGLTVAGGDFFTALGDEDLMPAADADAMAEDARFHNWANLGLAEGLDKLGGLDLEHDPEEGPTPIRTGSALAGMHSGGLGGSGTGGTGGAGGAGGPLGAPEPAPGPGPGPAPDPEPVPGPGPGPGPGPDPEPEPVPKPLLRITPIHGLETSDPVENPNMEDYAGHVGFTFSLEPAPEGETQIEVWITNSRDNTPTLHTVTLTDGTATEFFLHDNEEDVYWDASSVSVSVGDKYTLVDGDGKAVTQVTANVVDTITPVTATVDVVYDEETGQMMVQVSLVDADGNPTPAQGDVTIDVWAAEIYKVGKTPDLAHQMVTVTIPNGSATGWEPAPDLPTDLPADRNFSTYGKIVVDPDDPHPGNFEHLEIANEPFTQARQSGYLGDPVPGRINGQMAVTDIYRTQATVCVQILPPAPGVQLIATLLGNEYYGDVGPNGVVTITIPSPWLYSVYSSYEVGPYDRTAVATLIMNTVIVDEDRVPLIEKSHQPYGDQGTYFPLFLSTYFNRAPVPAPNFTTTGEVELYMGDDGQLWATVGLSTTGLDPNGNPLSTAPGMKDVGVPHTTTISFLVNGEEHTAVLTGYEESTEVCLGNLDDFLALSGDGTVTAEVTAFVSTTGSFQQQAFDDPFVFTEPPDPDLAPLFASFGMALDLVDDPEDEEGEEDDAADPGLSSYDDLLFGIDPAGGSSVGDDGVTVAGGCYDAAETMSAHGEIDFLIGPDDHFLDTLLNAHTLEDGTRHIHVALDAASSLHADVFVQVNVSAHQVSLTNADDLAANLGITIHDGQINLNDHWVNMETDQVIDGTTYTEWHYTNDGTDATILVQKSILENAQS